MTWGMGDTPTTGRAPRQTAGPPASWERRL
jgi:hypothetical protein